jgi:transaldolase
MQIFLDTAKIDEIRKMVPTGVVDGVTTNPSLLAKAGCKDIKGAIKEISELVKEPVSVEVIGTQADQMVKEAREYSAWKLNTAVKIPMTTEGLKAVSVLSKEGIKTNVTLVFSTSQGLLAAKAGATFVSPFVGRLDDISHNGLEVVRDLAHIFKIYGINTRIIAASIRHPIHVIESAKAGAHIATIPTKVLEAMFKHPLTDIGIEKFLSDWKGLQESK